MEIKAVNATKRQSVTGRYAVLPALAVAAILAACATTPPEDPQLIAARSAVAQLEADPLAQQTAGKPLQDARDALATAETLARDHKPQAEVDHFAFLAKRREIGRAHV